MTRWMRVGRGFLAASVSTFVAAFSHSIAGGPPPSGAGIALCLAFATIVCMLLAGRRMSRMRLAASVAASQVLYHLLFGLVPAPAAGAVRIVETAGALSGHSHSAGLAFEAAGAHAAHADPGMWAAHLLAAVVTFLALRHGELAVSALLALTRGMVASILPRAMPQPVVWSTGPARLAAWVRRAVPAIRRPLLSPMRHRGPPAPSFA